MELAADAAPLTAPLAALGDRVAPLALAGERTIPVDETFGDLFAEGGLVRGRTIACEGSAATSTALALVAPAVRSGAWLALIDLPTVGLDAASELGVPLERVVAIGTGPPGAVDDPGRWLDVVAAAADGFDVLLVRAPIGLSAGGVRKLSVRLRQRDVVTIVLGDPGSMACDGTLQTDAEEWSGLGDGHGHLRRRQVVVRASGRRLPGRRHCRFTIPATSTAPSVPAVAAISA
jgi:hypothetical protein